MPMPDPIGTLSPRTKIAVILKALFFYCKTAASSASCRIDFLLWKPAVSSLRCSCDPRAMILGSAHYTAEGQPEY